MPKVVVQNGSHAGKSFDLLPAGTQVGRVAPANIVLAEPSVSSRHAKIWKEGEQWMLVDLGSTNGTLLNGAICERSVNTPINDGDKISFGAVILKVVIEANISIGGNDNKQGATMGPGQISGAEILELAKKKLAPTAPAVVPVAPPPPPPPPQPQGFVAAPVGAYASEGAPVRSYENEIAVLKEEIAAAEQAAVRAREEAAQARAALTNATAPVTTLQAEVAALKGELATMVPPAKHEADLRAAEEKLRVEHERAMHTARAQLGDVETKANRFESELQAAQRQLVEARTAADESFTFQMAKQMAEQRAVIAETERDELAKRLGEVFAKQKTFDATLAEKDARIAELAANQAGPAVTAPPPVDVTPLNDRIAALEIDLARVEAEKAGLRDELSAQQYAADAELQSLRERITTLSADAANAPPPVDVTPFQERIAALENELAQLRAVPPVDVGPLNARIAALEEELVAAQDATTALNVKLGEQQSVALDQSDALRQRISELENAATANAGAAGAAGDRTAALEAELASERDALANLGNRLQHAESLAAGESQRAAALEAQLLALSQEAEALRAAAEEQLAALRSDLMNDRQALAAAASRNVELESSLAVAQQSLSQAGEAASLLGAERQQVEELRHKLAQVDVELQAARAEVARIPTLEATAYESDRLRQRLGEVEVALQVAREQATAAAEVESLRTQLAQLQVKMEKEHEAGARDTTAVMETLMRERAESAPLRDRVAALESALASAHAAADVPSESPELKARIDALTTERDEAVATLAASTKRAEQLDFQHRALMLERAQSQEDISRLQRDYAKAIDEMELLKTSGPQAPQAELASLQARLEDANARIEALQQSSDHALVEADRARDQLSEAENATAGVRAELNEVRAELEARLATLQAELDAAASRTVPPPGVDPTEFAEITARAGELQVALADARADAERAQERLDELRGERQSLLSERDALQAALDAAPSAGAAPSASDALASADQFHYAKAQGHVSREIALAALDRINADLGLLRRNGEILRGYVNDVSRLAQLVESIDPTWLPADAAPVLQQAVEEIQPSTLAQSLGGIAQESSEAASRAKGLVLDGREALMHEDEVDLERVLSKSQRLASLVHDEEELPVELPAGMLPPLDAIGPDGVGFGWALRGALRHAKAQGGDPAVRLSGDDSGVQLHAGPVPAATADKLRDASTDAHARVLHGFPAGQGGSFELREGDAGHSLHFSFPPKR